MAYRINDNVCDGCDACVTACPTQAIHGVQHEVHEIDSDLCVSCGLCMNLCRNFAIRSGAQHDIVEIDDWLIPSVDTSLCSGCSACVELCPMNALELSKPKFRGDTDTYAVLPDFEKCVGCEKCSEHCPVGAITMVKKLLPAELQIQEGEE